MVQMQAVKRGLFSIIPRQALSLLTWQDLRAKACGEPTVGTSCPTFPQPFCVSVIKFSFLFSCFVSVISFLRKRTVYAPKKYTEDSALVRNFWRTLESFSDEDRGKFLQFAWARSRLPPESESDSTWRMKVNFLEASSQHDLPTAETCFFNVNVPAYDSYETMREKLLMAVTHCSSITS